MLKIIEIYFTNFSRRKIKFIENIHLRERTESGVFKCVVAPHTTVQQIHRVLVTQVRGHSVHARPTAALSAAGINIQDCVPGLPFMAGFHACHGTVVLDAVFTAAKYVEVTEDNARDVRRPGVSAFTLKNDSEYRNFIYYSVTFFLSIIKN